jgi:tRNA nucleotidyltransferase (CCA-adding enzyme)
MALDERQERERRVVTRTGSSVNELRWEHFPHQADVGVRGLGPTREAAFEQAALALTAAICDPGAVRQSARVAIECEAEDEEMLLVAWLNAIVYEMATRRMLFGRYRTRIDGNRLLGEAWGEPVDVKRHQPAVEVKGATVTELRVAETSPGGWLAQCVIDV